MFCIFVFDVSAVYSVLKNFVEYSEVVSSEMSTFVISLTCVQREKIVAPLNE